MKSTISSEANPHPTHVNWSCCDRKFGKWPDHNPLCRASLSRAGTVPIIPTPLLRGASTRSRVLRYERVLLDKFGGRFLG